MPELTCGPSRNCVWKAADRLTLSGRRTLPTDLCIGMTSHGEPCGVAAVAYFGDEYEGGMQAFCSEHYTMIRRSVIDSVAAVRNKTVYSDPEPKAKLPPRGYVYFVRRGDLIKVGFTVQPKKRLTDLAFAGGGAFDDVVITKGSRALEARYHRAFAEFRVHGEWFTVTPVIVGEMERLRAKDPFKDRPLSNV